MNIPFKEFMKTYNFYYENVSLKTGSKVLDTQTIRIHYGRLYSDNADGKSDWFEFGIYPFSPKMTFEDNLGCIFNDRILNSYVDSFKVNDDTGVFEIWLSGEKDYED